MATTTTKSKTAAAELRDWPLMENNIARADLDAVIEFLQQDDPILTQSKNVAAFEEEWSEWLGVKHSVFVNSGSSANQITMAAVRERFGGGEIIVPTLTWVSDIASVLQNGFTRVFVDINPRTLGMDTRQVVEKISKRTRAVFLTHILGYNALDDLSAGGIAEAQHPAHRGRLRIARRDVQGPEARLVRVRLEFLVLLRPPHEHHRGRHGLHRRPGFLRDAPHVPLARHGAREQIRRVEKPLQDPNGRT